MTTETQIKELRNEAGAAGDLEMVAICDQALEGCEESIKDCARVIADARDQWWWPTLTASNGNSITVTDDCGGRWYPDDEAEQEIMESARPLLTAVKICATEPMRGCWVS